MTFEFDPFDPRFFADPYPFYAEMRRDHPVYRRELPEGRLVDHYWMLTRADDVSAAFGDWKTFSSANGPIIDTDASLIPPNLFNMDPPRHDQLRSILSRAMTNRHIASLAPQVEAFTRELVEGWRGRDTVDLATEFAHQIPTVTMCALLGLPVEDRAQFLKWNLDSHGDDFTSEAALRAYEEMEQYWVNLVEQRRSTPADDLISQILHADVEGAALSNEEISGFCSTLHHAAQNTTMMMLVNSAIALGRHPDERQKLLEEPTRWDTGVEELFRYESPVQGLARTTTRDVEVAGTTIPAGDQVLMLYGSANRDETKYDRPDTLDLDRDVRFHWAFGHGIHYCLGHAVARLEVRTAVRVLIEALPDYEVDEDSIVRYQLIPTRCVASAPITFDPDLLADA